MWESGNMSNVPPPPQEFEIELEGSQMLRLLCYDKSYNKSRMSKEDGESTDRIIGKGQIVVWCFSPSYLCDLISDILLLIKRPYMGILPAQSNQSFRMTWRICFIYFTPSLNMNEANFYFIYLADTLVHA